MSVYDVSEIDGILSFQIELISMIEREIQLLLNTSDGRATGTLSLLFCVTGDVAGEVIGFVNLWVAHT